MQSIRRSICASIIVLITVTGSRSEAQTTGGPYQYYSVAPCRFVDTRPAMCPGGAPAENCLGIPVYVRTERTFTAKGLCGIPSDARAVSANATVLQPTTYGDFRFYPSGTGAPLVSTINFTPSDLALANGTIVPLSSGVDHDMTTYLNSPYGTNGIDGAHLILDVTGYFK